MTTIHVFDPALFCSTGVCGAQVDRALVTFAADVDWLELAGGDDRARQSRPAGQGSAGPRGAKPSLSPPRQEGYAGRRQRGVGRRTAEPELLLRPVTSSGGRRELLLSFA